MADHITFRTRYVRAAEGAYFDGLDERRSALAAEIADHRTGAKSPSGGLAARRVSADLATQLERASDAAAMFNRLQAARGQTSTSVSVSRGSAA